MGRFWGIMGMGKIMDTIVFGESCPLVLGRRCEYFFWVWWDLNGKMEWKISQIWECG